MNETILVQPRAGYRVVTLNRPERMNALDRDTIARLLAVFDEAEADPGCRALLLTGAGDRAFCSGADLSAIGGEIGTRDLGESIAQSWNPLARRLHGLAMPTICAVNGMAAGAGASIALGCDIVIAGQSARFLQAFARIGLVPDCGGTFHLAQLAGQARARGMAMLAEPVDAATALAWGLIWAVVPDAELMAEAERLAARLSTMPTQALLLTRRAIAAAAANDFDTQLDLERDSQREAGFTPDHAEGVRAFLEKRAPVFTGRPA